MSTRSPHAAAPASRGFSLTEMLVVSGLAVSLFGTLALLGQRASASTTENTAEDHARALVEAALGRATRELADASAASLDPTPTTPFWSDTLTFHTATGFDTAGTTWSAPRRLELAEDPSDLDNGRDDDGDGVVDERLLRLVTSEGRVVVLTSQVRELGEGELANGEDDDGDGLVDEAGFAVVLDASGLRLALSLERRDAQDGTTIASGEACLWLGND